MLITSLYQIGAIQLGQFTLKSGQTASIYFDLRRIISYPSLLTEVADRMFAKVKHIPFDLVCGVPYTALPIATAISLKNDIPMIMCRKEKKSYGTKQQIEGIYSPEQNCLIIEDVITTGGSILTTARELRAVNLLCTDTVVLIDRESGATENLAQENIRTHAILTFSEILQHLLHSKVVPDTQKRILQTLLQEKMP